MGTLLITIASAWMGFFALGVIGVYATLRHPVRSRFRAVTPEELPPDARDYFERQESQLAGLGFSPVARAHWTNAGQLCFVSFLKSEEVGDRAMISYIQPVNARPVCSLEFMAELENGVQLMTNNARTALGLFARRPHRHVYQYPRRIEPSSLYGAHRRLVAVHGDGSPPVAMPDGALLAHVEADMAREQRFQIEAGLLTPTHDGDQVRPTIEGAVRFVWMMIPPIVWVRRALRERRFELALRRPPGSDDASGGPYR
jgi:hypothetical protein